MVWSIVAGFILSFFVICLAGNLPKLFLLGPMKSGSSSLFEFIIHHQKICPGVTKEINYVQDDHKIHGGRQGYRSQFVDKRCFDKNGTYFVDGSPQFHLMEKVIPRLLKLYKPEEQSQLRFIVILREPVARHLSYYEHFTMQSLAEGMEFSHVQMPQDRNRIANHTFQYVNSLKHFLKGFKREQILVLRSSDLFYETKNTMQIISDFLHVTYSQQWDQPFPHDDHMSHPRYRGIEDCVQKYVPEVDCAFRDELAKFYEPYNRLLYALLGETRTAAFPGEQAFKKFGDDFRKVKCVSDARGKYSKLLSQSAVSSCRTRLTSSDFDTDETDDFQ